MEPDIEEWRASSRLDGFAARMRRLFAADADAQKHLQRYAANLEPAAARAKAMLAGAA